MRDFQIKSKTAALALTVLLSASAGSFVFGQESVWQALFASGANAAQARNWPEAEKHLTAAWNSANEFENSDPRKAKTLRALAGVYSASGNYVAAESHYQQLLKLDDGATDAVRFVDLRALNHVLVAAGKFADAEKILQQQQEIAEKLNESNARASVCTDLAMLYQRTGSIGKVETLLLQAIKLKEQDHSKSDAAVLIAQERLADFYLSQGRLSEAETLYTLATTQRQIINAKDLSLSKNLASLAVLYQKQGKDAKADSTSKQAIAEVEKQFGQSQELAAALVVRGRLLSENRPDLAIIVLQKALQIRLKEATSDDQQLSATLLALGNAYLECDNYRATEKSVKQALAIDERAAGRKSPAVVLDLTTLGQLYLRQGKYSLSEQVYKEALEISRAIHGDEHPEVATCMNNLAFLYGNMGHLDQAQALLTQALAVREKVYGKSHIQVAQNLVNLADILVRNDQKSKAVPLLVRALAIEEQSLGADHDYVALILRELIDIMKDDNAQLDAAEQYARSLLARDQRLTSDSNLLVARDLEILAKVLISANKTAEAKPLIAQARSIEKAEKGLYFEQNQPAVVAAPAGAKPIQDKWALVVGISSFQDSSLNLRFAAKDAIDFKNFLITRANFQPDHVKLITDQDATRSNIVALLGDKWLKHVVKKDDMAVIYISSHGTQAASQVGGANFIVPYEGNAQNIVFSGIPMQWLVAGLKDLVHSDRICVFLDVCHGGAAANSEVLKEKSAYSEPAETAQSPGESGGKGIYRIRNITAETLVSPPGQIVVAASQADQISWESKRYSNGVFTRRLIEGLTLNGADTTLNQAFNYLKEQVEEEVLRDRTQLQAPVVVPKLGLDNEPKLGTKPANPRSPAEILAKPSGTKASSSSVTVKKQ